MCDAWRDREMQPPAPRQPQGLCLPPWAEGKEDRKPQRTLPRPKSAWVSQFM